MPHAVVQQVFEKASEQGTVDRNLCVFGGSCLIQRNFAVFCQGTVVELSDQFTEQRSGGKSFFSEWLRTIFQFAGQIQVVNKRSEFFTLSTNSCSFVPYCIGQGRILFQLFSPSKIRASGVRTSWLTPAIHCAFAYHPAARAFHFVSVDENWSDSVSEPVLR